MHTSVCWKQCLRKLAAPAWNSLKIRSTWLLNIRSVFLSQQKYLLRADTHISNQHERYDIYISLDKITVPSAMRCKIKVFHSESESIFVRFPNWIVEIEIFFSFALMRFGFHSFPIFFVFFFLAINLSLVSFGNNVNEFAIMWSHQNVGARFMLNSFHAKSIEEYSYIWAIFISEFIPDNILCPPVLMN